MLTFPNYLSAWRHCRDTNTPLANITRESMHVYVVEAS